LGVQGRVLSLEGIDAADFQWPFNSVYRKRGTYFARISLDNGNCYLLGPRVSGWVRLGDSVDGQIAAYLVDDWPLEVFLQSKSCFPLGEIQIVSEQ
jgi:hypothetical protein